MMRSWTTLLMVSVFVAGCSSSRQDEVSAWMTREKSQAQPKVKPLKEPLVFHPVAFDRGGAVDPFSFQKLAQVFAIGDVRQGVPQWVLDAQNRRKEPLESYPLDTMKMVGFIQKAASPTALISVDNHLYQVSTGNYLGQNLGRIVSVRETQLELREIVQDTTGDWLQRSTVVELQE